MRNNGKFSKLILFARKTTSLDECKCLLNFLLFDLWHLENSFYGRNRSRLLITFFVQILHLVVISFIKLLEESVLDEDVVVFV